MSGSKRTNTGESSGASSAASVESLSARVAELEREKRELEARLDTALRDCDRAAAAFKEEKDELTELLEMATAHGDVVQDELHDEAAESLRRMSVMLDISQSLNETLELPVMIQKIVREMTLALNCERSSLYVLDKEKNELWSMQAHGIDLEEIRFSASLGLAGHAATTGEVVNVADAYQDARFNQEIDRQSGLRTQSVLCVPVRNRAGDVTGVIQVVNKIEGAFDDPDQSLMSAVASQIGVVLENAQLHASTVEMKNYLQSVQESISNGILTLDVDGRVVTANSAAAAILEAPDLVQSHPKIRKLLGDENDYLLSLILGVYDTRDNVVQYDISLHRRSAVAGTVNANVVPLNDGHAQFQGLVVVLDDVTTEKRVKSTLTRYMAKDIVDRMLADPLEQVLGGKRGTASVLFSDIRRFTSIAERLTAEQTMDMLNEYFTLMVDEVMNERGLLDKFMGDGLMAVFGVPYPQPDDAVRAVRSALGMHRALEGLNEIRLGRGHEPLSIGIGIHSDEVISGNMGSEKRMEYTVIGDGVNLAARIEGLNKAYDSGILISDSTYAQSGDEFVVRRVDNVAVKGRAEPIHVYEVLGERGFPLTAAQSVYEEGLERYEARDFRAALDWFRRGADADGLCRTYVERCEQYIVAPPPDDWDGVWQALSK